MHGFMDMESVIWANEEFVQAGLYVARNDEG